MIGEQYVVERQFTETQVRTIRNGETTKKEILDRLGPPGAVVRPERGATDNVFQRFAATGGTVTGRIVYRYQASALNWSDLCFFGGYGGGGCITSTPALNEQKLWILIDENTGRVVDHSIEETKREESGAGIRPWLGPGF